MFVISLLVCLSDVSSLIQEDDVDIDEVECIVANLIHANRIKGYVSHAAGKLVVSKENAFPSLNA